MRMLFRLILATLLFCDSFADTGAIKDPQYTFDPTKLAAAESPLKFMRSYVDYFYLILVQNKSSFSSLNDLQSATGWCVGDAHPENFGALLQSDGSSLFTMNDLDDGGPCPVGLDLLRLMVSSHLALKDISIEALRGAYLKGVRGENISTPVFIGDLLKKSQKKGTQISAKKITGNRIVRDGEMNEVTEVEKQSIANAMTGLGSVFAPRAQLLDVVSSRKIGGGSGGLLRYELLIDKAGEKLLLELKEQPRPAIYSVLVGEVPEISLRISKGVQYTQGPNPSKYYVGVTVGGRDMLMRPLFPGNMSLEIADHALETARQIVYFEAFTLGQIHARSVIEKQLWAKRIEGLPLNSLTKDVMLISNHFVEKFRSLKPN